MEEDRRCRCYERQRDKPEGDLSLSHTRWTGGLVCVLLGCQIHYSEKVSESPPQGRGSDVKKDFVVYY